MLFRRVCQPDRRVCTCYYNDTRAENVTMNNHQDGVAPDLYRENAQLAAFYNLLSTNVDRDGNPFASTMEGALMLK